MFPFGGRSNLTPAERRRRANAASPVQTSGVIGPLNANQYSGEYEFSIRAQAGLLELNWANLRVLEAEVEALFDRCIEHVVEVQGLSRNDYIQVLATSNMHVWSNLSRVSALDGSEMVNRIELALSSYDSFVLNGALIVVRYYKQQRGNGYKQVFKNVAEFVKRKRCVIEVKSKKMCFWVSVGLGLAQYNRPDEYKQLLASGGTSRYKLREARGKILMNECGLEESVASSDFSKIESKLKISLLIVDYDGMKITYSSKLNFPVICLLATTDECENLHYHYVNKDHIGALWERRKFCFNCMKGYQDTRHKCFSRCHACQSIDCEGKDVKLKKLFTLKCMDCNCHFLNQECFNNHLKKLCKKFKLCEECNYLYTRKDAHKCGERMCGNCKQFVAISEEHLCYHQPLTTEDLAAPSEKYIYYDYETFLDESNIHVVAGIVACYHCEDKFYRFFSTSEFVDWLLRKEHKGFTAIAHNSGRYDFHFIKQEFLQRGVKTSDISNGNTVFYSKVEKLNLRFIDSYRLIPVALRNFPKTFGLKEMCKGYFPYRFLRKETMGYVGPLPDIEWFDFENMKDEYEYKKACEWYEEHKDTEIYLMELCWKYCESDVQLLKEGCKKFRELFMAITSGEIDPLQHITIASVCMTLFRRFFLQSNTIGVIEKPSDESQYLETLWYAWRSFVEDCDAREKYEFMICLDNGCKDCYNPYTRHPKSGFLMKDIYYESTKELKSSKKEIIWEHSVEKCSAMKEFESTYFEYEDVHFNLREAFYGGRTEPIYLHRKIKEGEKIRYVDFTSLYPSVQYGELRGLTESTYGEVEELEYPIGHPVWVYDATPETLHQYYGAVKCDIQPPDDLFIPVLPEKKDGKLMFDNTFKKGGIWMIKEVLLAMRMGYKITKIYSVQHFPERSKELFKGYVKKFLKLKVEAAGWKKLDCKSDFEKRLFLERFESVMGVELDAASIGDELNEGLYAIAKLCLNNLWGKYGQRDNYSNTVDIFSWKELQLLVQDCTLDILGMILHGSKARTVTYKQSKDFVSVPGYTNIAIAAMTTTHARCRLYELLLCIDPENILYMDTDSCIFVETHGNHQVRCGEYLGDLTDELGNGDYIVEFVSVGPKSYAYRTFKGKVCVKVKGISLTRTTLDIVNFESIKKMVYDPSHVVLTKPLKFIIGKDHNIETKKYESNEGKKFRLTMNKRHVEYDESNEFVRTYPFPKRSKFEE